jgi:hypothetical protein
MESGPAGSKYQTGLSDETSLAPLEDANPAIPIPKTVPKQNPAATSFMKSVPCADARRGLPKVFKSISMPIISGKIRGKAAFLYLLTFPSRYSNANTLAQTYKGSILASLPRRSYQQRQLSADDLRPCKPANGALAVMPLGYTLIGLPEGWESHRDRRLRHGPTPTPRLKGAEKTQK